MVPVQNLNETRTGTPLSSPLPSSPSSKPENGTGPEPWANPEPQLLPTHPPDTRKRYPSVTRSGTRTGPLSKPLPSPPPSHTDRKSRTILQLSHDSAAHVVSPVVLVVLTQERFVEDIIFFRQLFLSTPSSSQLPSVFGLIVSRLREAQCDLPRRVTNDRILERVAPRGVHIDWSQVRLSTANLQVGVVDVPCARCNWL